MALILATRIIMQVSQWDDATYSVVNSSVIDDEEYYDEDDLPPMPIGFL